MSWIREVFEDAICASVLGCVRGAFGVSIFTEKEVEEIASLKKLALSVAEKAPKLATDPVVCEQIKTGQEIGLETFVKDIPAEATTTGVVAAAELVCRKTFCDRFKKILMGACLNLVGC